MNSFGTILQGRPESELKRELLNADASSLLSQARKLRDSGHGDVMSYSRKVFVPLTQLCRDVCHYCSFSRPPKENRRAFLRPDEVLAIARAGQDAHCHEVLFTLGDKPELRWEIARTELDQLGYATTLEYLYACCEKVLSDTDLLPHLNPGVMTRAEMARLREVSVSMGIMLENVSPRLLKAGQVHYGSPDKVPARRLETIALAGELAIPFTSGILIGIGETREERLDSLLALRELHDRYGHLQEVIVQNFRAKAGTPMEGFNEPDFDDLCWTVAAARMILGEKMNIQAPPNLSPGTYRRLVEAGINDWGGISPVTVDHVNPEAAWPQIQVLETQTARAGKGLSERLAIYPAYASDSARWTDSGLRGKVMRKIDARGWPRSTNWVTSSPLASAEDFRFPTGPVLTGRSNEGIVAGIIARCTQGHRASLEEIDILFNVTGSSLTQVMRAADNLRENTVGDVVRYVVNRNINYTNVCTHKCGFCAFSKGRASVNLRGSPYDLSEGEIRRRVAEAWARGATEVCMQGGIHPEYDGHKYLDLVRMVRQEQPLMHVHAFSPLEVHHGATTLSVSLETYLRMLRAEGLATLPGTAAEILDDEIRDIICPGKLSSAQWLDVMRVAHKVGIRTTATIMFGHVDNSINWARHLLAIRDLQVETGGFTEFVPLPFIPVEAPMYLRGLARKGPTPREVVLMHAVSRLVLHPHISHIQASWVKLGPHGVRACLSAGANDLGGTLMNESISRAAGACHGQEMTPEMMEALIGSCGRLPQQRTTLYGSPDLEQKTRSYGAPAPAPIVLDPVVFRKTVVRRKEKTGVSQV